MLAPERLLQIEELYDDQVVAIVPLDLDGETLRLVLYLTDGSNLRVAEQWEDQHLKHKSYYWLTADNRLKTGWDNASHHTHVPTHPHHKHVDQQGNLQPSSERSLEDVMTHVLSTM